MRKLVSLAIVIVGLFAASSFADPIFAGSYVISHVDSAAFKTPGTDTIRTGTTVKIYLGIDNSATPYNLGAFSNGFVIYSPDGATWTNTTMDTVFRTGGIHPIIGKTEFAGGFFINSWNADGEGRDTVAVAAFTLGTTAIAAGVRVDSAFVITIGPIPAGIVNANHNKHICIDSTTNFPPTNVWTWSDYDIADDIIPSFTSHCWTLWDEQTPVKDDKGSLPQSFSLAQNYPNPFNPSTEIKFSIAEKSRVTLTVYNVLGQAVRTLVNEELTAGNYRHEWDGRDDRGKVVTTGVYFYKLQAGTWTETKKMTFLK